MLTISKPRQLVVPLIPDALDRPINMAASRNFCGDFFEAATVALFGGKRLKTDSTKDVCPDIEVGAGMFLESKCVGVNGSAILYTHRREKDLRFMQENNTTIDYVFWRHDVAVQSIAYLSELRMALSQCFLTCLRIPAAMLHADVLKRKTRLLNTKTKTPNGKRLGYGTNGYGVGWSIPYRDLQAMCGPLEYDRVEAYGHACELMRGAA